jgi:hypothetical protein
MKGHVDAGFLATAAIVVVGAAVAVGIAIVGPPGRLRDGKLDQRRVSNLEDISALVESYRQRHKALPVDLTALGQEPGARVATDPQSSVPYSYEVISEKSYRLCATFATDSADDRRYERYRTSADWMHGVGKQCFDRTTKPSECCDNTAR